MPVRRRGAEGLPDITWFTPDGAEMSEDDWDTGFRKAIAVYLNGNGIGDRDPRGQRVTDLLAGYDAVIVQGPATGKLHPGAAFARYGRNRVHLQQIVWPDAEGRFPWEGGYAFDTDVQPLIGLP